MATILTIILKYVMIGFGAGAAIVILDGYVSNVYKRGYNEGRRYEQKTRRRERKKDLEIIDVEYKEVA